ncbi:MAG TPA: hypothetical protein PK598_13045 [Thermoanaerobaculia bacterium]|nr:hypothetical protein [Thermoanaerobaculia bacterium]
MVHVVDLTSDEIRYLEAILSRARKDLLHEIHHAATHDYKEWLRGELAVNERLSGKLLPAMPAKKSA